MFLSTFRNNRLVWENQVQQTLIRYAEIEYEEARHVNIVPVGDFLVLTYVCKKILNMVTTRPENCSLSDFGFKCTDRMKAKSTCKSLLQG